MPGHSPLTSAPEYEDFVVGLWSRETFGPFWQQPDICAAAHYDRFSDVPMVFMSSWYDPYALSATDNFSALSRMKTGPVRLVMGPWTHGQRSVSHAGDVDFGPHATLDGALAEDYVALRGEARAREAGKLRAEGKSYVVKDGDVMNFLFN